MINFTYKLQHIAYAHSSTTYNTYLTEIILTFVQLHKTNEQFHSNIYTYLMFTYNKLPPHYLLHLMT